MDYSLLLNNFSDHALTEFYYECAKQNILQNFLTGKVSYMDAQFQSHNLNEILLYHEDSYQIIIYEKYHLNACNTGYDFFDLFKLSTSKREHFDSLSIAGQNIILLRGKNVINHFSSILAKYSSQFPPQNNSPLDNCFLACGRIVTELKDLPQSYLDALHLLQRRFFCKRHQHYLQFESNTETTTAADTSPNTENVDLSKYIDDFVILIQTYNRHRISDLLKELEDQLYCLPINVTEAKNFLLDLYSGIKEKIGEFYKEYDIPFVSNSSAIQYILGSNYSYQVFEFLMEQFEIIMNSTGHFSRDSIIDVIINYVDHNYAENITLDNISPIFGYNSSYLGKIFTQKTGQNFHAYLDEVRIEKSKELLEESKLPVYRIASKVGYNNVDYFHVKFKNKTGISPASYRKKVKEGASL
ncbi:MAG: helix-turn-helix transcriptional regulator [Lachnospiraceae bacterium]